MLRANWASLGNHRILHSWSRCCTRKHFVNKGQKTNACNTWIFIVNIHWHTPGFPLRCGYSQSRPAIISSCDRIKNSSSHDSGALWALIITNSFWNHTFALETLCQSFGRKSAANTLLSDVTSKYERAQSHIPSYKLERQATSSEYQDLIKGP